MVFSSVLMILAFEGYETCPLGPTDLMRFPSITTTALLMGFLPVPSMRVPPSSTTVGAWALAFSEPSNTAIVTSHVIRDLLMCGFETCQLCIVTFLDDGQEARRLILAHKRMRFARLAVRQCTDLILCHVVSGMDRQIHIDSRLVRDVHEPDGGCGPRLDDSFQSRPVPNAVAVQIGIDTSPYGANMLLVSVLQRNQDRNRARGMTRREVNRQRSVAQRQLHAVRRNHILLRLHLVRIGADLDSMPIGFGRDEVRVVRILDIFRTPVTIAMSVGEDQIFDLRRIFTELFESIGDQLFLAVIHAGVDQYDSLGGFHRPDGVTEYRRSSQGIGMAAQPIQIVKYLRRFAVPFRTRWDFVVRKLGAARRGIRLRRILVARFSRQCRSANGFVQRR